MTSAMAIDLAERRVNEFRQRCGDYGEAALRLAYHAALPVALNAELLHLLRINFFLDPPETLPYTVEYEFLLSPLCREIDQGLYEIEPEIRDALLAGLTQTYGTQRIRDLATLLWQYVEHHSPWGDRVELERAQQLTALNFLDAEKAKQWLATVDPNASQGEVAEREWFVAMRQEIEKQTQFQQDEATIDRLLITLQASNHAVRQRAVEALGNLGSEAAIPVLISALHDENNTVRSSAAEALGKIGSEAAIPALASALSDINNVVRSSTAEALGKIGSELAIPALASALGDPNKNVRLSVTEALGKIGSGSAIPALLEALNDSDSEVRQHTASTLMKLGHDQENDDLFDSVLDRLTEETYIASLRSISDSKEWIIRGEVMRIGRGEGNDLILQQPEVSRQHAEIVRRDFKDGVTQPTYSLRDFSRHGTWMATPEIKEWQLIQQQEVELLPGTQLKFGNSRGAILEFAVMPIEIIGLAEKSIEEIESSSKSYISSNVKPVQIFISYDRRDEVFYNQLLKHLSALRQERVIVAWHDRCTLHEGEENYRIDPFLESADIILFLVSADFFASLYWETEVLRALERQDMGQAKVIPVILRPVDWSSTPLSKLQALPKNGNPVIGWGNRDEAFLDVVQEIREVAEQMAMQSPSTEHLSPEKQRLEKVVPSTPPQLDALEPPNRSLTEAAYNGSVYSPYNQYYTEIERLIRQGASNQIVQQQLLSKYPQLTTQAAQILKHIQAIEREIRRSRR